MKRERQMRINGGAERDRTVGLQSAILALSQLSYCPNSYKKVSVLARRSASARRRDSYRCQRIIKEHLSCQCRFESPFPPGLPLGREEKVLAADT